MNTRVPLLCLVAWTCLPAQAQGVDATKTLYDQNCIACHGTEVYTRDDRRVTSFPGLERQVRRCELSLGLKWFDDEIVEVTDYLNSHFYHFEP